ncbi:MAG: four helix bundle protein [Ignavibacteria bacterium]|nr:four helix bundle protein [Ignavibacteria bacterium]
MLNLNHKNPDVWKISVELVADIYELTEKFPKTEIFGLSNQLRRASVSITSNIGEGSARPTLPDRKKFYNTARSSLVEIDSQLEVAVRLKFTNYAELTKIDEKMNELFAKLTNLINKTK